MTLRYRLPTTAPAPNFPVYGLADMPTGSRALDFIATFRGPDQSSAQTYGLWLGHVAADRLAGVRIGTFDRSTFERIEPSRDGACASAIAGTNALVDLTLPGLPGQLLGEPTPGLVKLVCAHARCAAADHRSWPRMTWLIDDTTVEVSTWQFAGAWTAFTDGLRDECVVAVGIGLSPAGLRLTRIIDGSAYGCDLTAPLDRNHHQQQARDWHETILPKPNATRWHADHLDLLEEP